MHVEAEVMGKPTILIADADCGVRSALRRRSTAHGYQGIESLDELGVLAHSATRRGDALIVDHEMPNGNGRSIAPLMRKECDAPIAFLSGHPREDFRRIVMRLSDTYSLAEPLDTVKLLDLLKALIHPPTAAPNAA